MMTPETQKQLKITDVSAKKLDKLNLHTAWDLVLHLPLRYEDETHIMPIKVCTNRCAVSGRGRSYPSGSNVQTAQAADRPNRR